MTATATDSRLALGIIAEALGDVHGMTDEELGAMARAVLSEIGIRDVMATVPSLTSREWDLLVEGLARFVEDHRAAMTGAPVATVECPAWCVETECLGDHAGEIVTIAATGGDADTRAEGGVQVNVLPMWSQLPPAEAAPSVCLDVMRSSGVSTACLTADEARELSRTLADVGALLG